MSANVVVDHTVTTQSPVRIRRRRGECHVRTQLRSSVRELCPGTDAHLVAPTLADITRPTSHPRLHGDPVSHLPSLRLRRRAELGDGPARFVAETHRFFKNVPTDSGMSEVVDIRTANPCLRDFDENLVVENRGNGPLRALTNVKRLMAHRTHVLEPHILDTVQHEARVVGSKLDHGVG